MNFRALILSESVALRFNLNNVHLAGHSTGARNALLAQIQTPTTGSHPVFKTVELLQSAEWLCNNQTVVETGFFAYLATLGLTFEQARLAPAATIFPGENLDSLYGCTVGPDTIRGTNLLYTISQGRVGDARTKILAKDAALPGGSTGVLFYDGESMRDFDVTTCEGGTGFL